MKKIAHLLFGRFSVVALAIILQFFWLVLVMYEFSYQFTYANLAIRLIAVIVVLVIINRWTNPANKLSWTFIILLSPVLGLLLYVIFGRRGLTKGMRVRMDAVNREVAAHLSQSDGVAGALRDENLGAAMQSNYIYKWAGYPVYANTKTEYYRCGEEMFPAMLSALEGAERFIFMEYFIVEEGKMFDAIADVLERKAKAGVDVRFIYDDIGCVNTLPPKYYKTLEKRGIQCAVFNPFKPVMSVIMNNRDHRKIFVVDGKIGFTGGINLADEYINETSRFGYWKDTGVRMEGDAVKNLTAMFLEMWNYIKRSTEDYGKFLTAAEESAWASESAQPLAQMPEKAPGQSQSAEDAQSKSQPSKVAQSVARAWRDIPPDTRDGFVQPYGDSPLDLETVGENIYLNIINDAKKYVYIFTPYLIIDNQMIVCLCNAAKKGVDVRIVTPGIPDKKLIYLLTQSHYEPLLGAGVKIYQYTPGFIHAKSFLCDDVVGTVGSVNLDYRSLYLHFECGVFLYKTGALEQLRRDCLETFAQSREVTLEQFRSNSLLVHVFQGIMRLLAPLL